MCKYDKFSDRVMLIEDANLKLKDREAILSTQAFNRSLNFIPYEKAKEFTRSEYKLDKLDSL